MDIFWGGHHKIGLYLGVISMHFRVFSYTVNVQNGGYFLGLVNFQIFFGCLKFLIFFGMNGRCLARAYVRRKNEKGVNVGLNLHLYRYVMYASSDDSCKSSHAQTRKSHRCSLMRYVPKSRGLTTFKIHHDYLHLLFHIQKYSLG